MPRPGANQAPNKAPVLFNNPKFGDVTVVCSDGRKFYCSKWKLAEQSEFFYNALSGFWRESNASTIELEESDSTPIEAMLYFLHTGHYIWPSSTSSSSHPSSPPAPTIPAPRITISNHISLFATADFYCVDGLREKAREFFDQQFPRHAVDDAWFAAVEQVYTTTLSREGGLGEVVIRTALARMYQVNEYPGERWLGLCMKHPDILRDLFRKLRAGPAPVAAVAGGVDFAGDASREGVPSVPAVGFPDARAPGWFDDGSARRHSSSGLASNFGGGGRRLGGSGVASGSGRGGGSSGGAHAGPDAMSDD